MKIESKYKIGDSFWIVTNVGDLKVVVTDVIYHSKNERLVYRVYNSKHDYFELTEDRVHRTRKEAREVFKRENELARYDSAKRRLSLALQTIRRGNREALLARRAIRALKHKGVKHAN